MTDDALAAALDAWWQRLCAALELPEVPADHDTILALAGDAAHAVVRPAAPIATFLAGYAAGRAGGSAADIAHALQRAREAARA